MKPLVNFLIIGGFVYFLGTWLAENGSAVSPVKATNAGCSVSFDGYQRLTTGMGYAQAVQILGCPGQEMSRSEMAGYTTVMVMWDGRGMFGANMNAMFQNGGLVNKSQFGLK